VTALCQNKVEFADIFPVYANTVADKPPLFSLIFAGVAKPGEPFNRGTYFPTIEESNMNQECPLAQAALITDGNGQ